LRTETLKARLILKWTLWAALLGAPCAALAEPAGAFDDWIIYHVTVEMFADGNRANDGEITGWKQPNYAGGDLQGLLDHLDHLEKLGINAVWLSPVFAARSSHGYDVTNYYRIGDAVGVPGKPDESLALFQKLRGELAKRGIRTILDIPLNHAAGTYQKPEGDPDGLRPRTTAARQDAEKLWDSWGSGYRYWDFGHEPTRRFLKNVALHWLRDEGVDGLRLDYVRGVPHDFWAELYGEVKAAKPGAFLVGECWQDEGGPEGNAREMATYAAPIDGKPQFDALLDFPLQAALTAACARGGSGKDLESSLQSFETIVGPGAALARFLDNHDLARFMAWADRPERLTAALGFMASLSGPMVLYYGTETGLAHGGPKGGFTDVGRLPMPWGKLDAGLVEKTSRILHARRAHPALSRGERLPLFADKTALAFAKKTGDETILVATNLGTAPRELTLDPKNLVATKSTFEPVFGEAVPSFVSAEGTALHWTLPPLSTVAVVVRSAASPTPDH